jgi:DNA-binding MarR family transcriptional regulator
MVAAPSLTYRTLRVLTVIAERPGASNRAIADAAGISDEGQISRLLRRLESRGWVKNSGEGHTKGKPNAWSLTPAGALLLSR